jgi:hypothetical protein
VEFIVGNYNNHVDYDYDNNDVDDDDNNNVAGIDDDNNNVAGIDDDCAGTNNGATGTKFSSYYRSNYGSNNYNRLVVKCSANIVTYNFCCGYFNNS